MEVLRCVTLERGHLSAEQSILLFLPGPRDQISPGLTVGMPQKLGLLLATGSGAKPWKLGRL